MGIYVSADTRNYELWLLTGMGRIGGDKMRILKSSLLNSIKLIQEMCL